MSNADNSAKAATNRALQILNVFRDIDPDMPMGEAVSLLLIALGETKDGGGMTVTDLKNQGDFAMSSASRYMKSLGKKDRHGRAGAEMVSDARDPMDERRKVLRLTAKGRRAVEKIQQLTGA